MKTKKFFQNGETINIALYVFDGKSDNVKALFSAKGIIRDPDLYNNTFWLITNKQFIKQFQLNIEKKFIKTDKYIVIATRNKIVLTEKNCFFKDAFQWGFRIKYNKNMDKLPFFS
jgi:hypothetical protein